MALSKTYQQARQAMLGNSMAALLHLGPFLEAWYNGLFFDFTSPDFIVWIGGDCRRVWSHQGGDFVKTCSYLGAPCHARLDMQRWTCRGWTCPL